MYCYVQEAGHQNSRFHSHLSLCMKFLLPDALSYFRSARACSQRPGLSEELFRITLSVLRNTYILPWEKSHVKGAKHSHGKRGSIAAPSVLSYSGKCKCNLKQVTIQCQLQRTVLNFHQSFCDVQAQTAALPVTGCISTHKTLQQFFRR